MLIGRAQECITEHVVPLYGASDARFHSAGREDVDVRMLGSGRPFTLELVAPKRYARKGSNPGLALLALL